MGCPDSRPSSFSQLVGTAIQLASLASAQAQGYKIWRNPSSHPHRGFPKGTFSMRLMPKKLVYIVSRDSQDYIEREGGKKGREISPVPTGSFQISPK